MTGRHTGSGRALALAAALCLCAVGCQQPQVGVRITAAAPTEGPRIVLEDAAVDLHGHVVATFSVTQDDLPLALERVLALQPRFTLATLGLHPVDGFRAWRSQILSGPETALSLPPSGPGTPPEAVIASARQPGSEAPTSLVDLGAGRFRFSYATGLTGFDPDDTLRVGVFLRAAPSPSLRTATTLDFRPSGGPVEVRQSVLDANCAQCHGAAPVHHDGRAGVRLCETCHTWQSSDPDTIDPAALSTTALPARTDPNPLELGRLVHRIHRGKALPTLWRSSTPDNPAPALAVRDGLPFSPDVDTTALAARLPFSPENNTTGLVGRRYAIVGDQGAQLVPGRIVQRTDNGMPARTVAQGISFPRDLRDCGVCHAGAPSELMVRAAISRRTCAGCHPDVWFQATPSTLDEGHFAHSGGVQADDSRCRNCHLEAPPGWKLYAPIELAHAPIPKGIRYGGLQLQILRVEGLVPGGSPRVTFRLSDRAGPLTPSLADPVPAFEPSDSATASFVPRSLRAPPRGSTAGGALTIRIAGPTAPDYGVTSTFLTSGGTTNPDPLALAAVGDEYVYTFSSTTVPASATGTWVVGMEARRRLKYGPYDPATDTFRWPYTGETVVESPDNAVVYVDVATGQYVANATHASPGATARRAIVAQQKCLRCHGRLELHGKARHDVEYCLICHTPTTTDYPNRKKVGGVVDLTQSYDGIEERSVHFKVMNHRIHTGGHAGSASLEGIAPFAMAGLFFDDARYPNDLADCTACHAGKTYLPEAVPADAPPTVANETATVLHASAAHVPGEPARPPIQAACTGCHATGATFAHVTSKTVGGVETCPQCHGAKGVKAVEVVHGLAPLTTPAASTAFSSILQNVLVPRCASCHAAGGTPPDLEAAAAYGALLGGASGQTSLRLVEPNAPERSYLLFKLRGTAGSVGGIGTPMPTEGALAPADVAAIEAWISSGAPND